MSSGIVLVPHNPYSRHHLCEISLVTRDVLVPHNSHQLTLRETRSIIFVYTNMIGVYGGDSDATFVHCIA